MGTGSFDRRVGGAGEHFGDIVAGDLHFHGADFDFEVGVIEAAEDAARAADRLQLDCIAFRYMLDELRLGVGVSVIGTSRVGDDGGVELLAEFAAHFRDAALGVFRELLRGGAVLDCIDSLARVIFEVFEEAVELLLHLANLELLFAFALGGELRFLFFQFGSRGRAGAGVRLRLRAVRRAGGREIVATSWDWLVRRAREAEMISGLSPSRCAMLMPAEAPGTPTRSS